MSVLFRLLLVSALSACVSSQLLHNNPTFFRRHQNILVIGETGAGHRTSTQRLA